MVLLFLTGSHSVNNFDVNLPCQVPGDIFRSQSGRTMSFWHFELFNSLLSTNYT